MIKDRIIKCQEIIENNIGLVNMIIKRFKVNDFDRDDLRQAGMIGLWKAAYHFDPNKGFAFSSYAVKYIMGEIKKEWGKMNLIKISRQYYKIIHHMKAGDHMSVDEIIKRTGCHKEDIIVAYNLMNNVSLTDDDEYFKDEEENNNNRYKISKIAEMVLELHFKNHMKQIHIANRLGISQSKVSRILKRYCT